MSFLFLCIGFGYSSAAVALSDISVLNAGFEMSVKYWNREGNVKLEKSVVYDGDRAVTLNAEGAILKQNVYVQPDEKYVLNTMLNGHAEIGVIVGSKAYSKSLNSEDFSSFRKRLTNNDWIQVSVPFETTSKTRSVTIFVKYIDETATVDNFSIK